MILTRLSLLTGAFVGAAILLVVYLIRDALRIRRSRRQAVLRSAARQARLADYQARVDAGGHRVRIGWWIIPGGKKDSEGVE